MKQEYDRLTGQYQISARQYFEILRLAILHVAGEYLQTSAEIAQYDASPEVYEVACKILKTLYGGGGGGGLMSINVEDDLGDFIKDSMTHWVGKHFGSQELEDPSWNIEALSRHLATALEKREEKLNSLQGYEISILTKPLKCDMLEEIASRVKVKIERVGGVWLSHEVRDKEFSRPMEGETHGHEIRIRAELPSDNATQRAISRWLGRQLHGNIIHFMILPNNN